MNPEALAHDVHDYSFANTNGEWKPMTIATFSYDNTTLEPDTYEGYEGTTEHTAEEVWALEGSMDFLLEQIEEVETRNCLVHANFDPNDRYAINIEVVDCDDDDRRITIHASACACGLMLTGINCLVNTDQEQNNTLSCRNEHKLLERRYDSIFPTEMMEKVDSYFGALKEAREEQERREAEEEAA